MRDLHPVTKAIGIIINLFSAGLMAFQFGGLFDAVDVVSDYTLHFGLVIVVATVIFYLLFVLQIVLHEAGHLIFGLLTGYQFCSFRIFSFQFQKDENGKLKLYNYSLDGTLGQCIMNPPANYDENSPYVLYNLGGVLVNSICLLMSLVLVLVFEKAILIKRIALLFASQNLYTILTNGLPIFDMTNDGRNIVEISKCKEAKIAFFIQMSTVNYLKNNIPVSKFPEGLLYKPGLENKDNYFVGSLSAYYVDKLMESHQFLEAYQYIKYLFEQDYYILNIYQMILKTNLIYCMLYLDINEIHEVVNDKFRKDLKPLLGNLTVNSRMYMYEKYYKNNQIQAEVYYSRYKKIAKGYPYKVEVEIENQLIEILNNKFETSNQE